MWDGICDDNVPLIRKKITAVDCDLITAEVDWKHEKIKEHPTREPELQLEAENFSERE